MLDGLWVMLLEAVVALGMLLGIVWATWPKGKQQAPQAADPSQARVPREDKRKEGVE